MVKFHLAHSKLREQPFSEANIKFQNPEAKSPCTPLPTPMGTKTSYNHFNPRTFQLFSALNKEGHGNSIAQPQWKLYNFFKILVHDFIKVCPFRQFFWLKGLTKGYRKYQADTKKLKDSAVAWAPLISEKSGKIFGSFIVKIKCYFLLVEVLRSMNVLRFWRCGGPFKGEDDEVTLQEHGVFTSSVHAILEAYSCIETGSCDIESSPIKLERSGGSFMLQRSSTSVS